MKSVGFSCHLCICTVFYCVFNVLMFYEWRCFTSIMQLSVCNGLQVGIVWNVLIQRIQFVVWTFKHIWWFVLSIHPTIFASNESITIINGNVERKKICSSIKWFQLYQIVPLVKSAGLQFSNRVQYEILPLDAVITLPMQSLQKAWVHVINHRRKSGIF